MTEVRRDPTRSPTARRIGYAVGALVNLVLLWLVDVAPGWRAVPFLTSDMTHVLGWVNASFVVGIVANLMYLWRDRPWVIAVGGVATTSVGLAAVLRLLRVFPFAFGAGGIDWALVVRIVLVVGAVGSAIGVVVNLVALFKAIGTGTAAP
jgi:hypothetical protein